MRKQELRISRRAVQMGDSEQGIFKVDYELCGIKWRGASGKAVCLKNILCDCERRKCPGRTLTISYYMRKLKEA